MHISRLKSAKVYNQILKEMSAERKLRHQVSPFIGNLYKHRNLIDFGKINWNT